VHDWASFWDQPHSIYVNQRHCDVHYRDIAQGIIALLPGREIPGIGPAMPTAGKKHITVNA